VRVYGLSRNRESVRLPLFPLQTVLFPGATLPLHIFEPRYREMIGRCLEHEEPFGICLILEGEEVGEPAIPHRVGTEAGIVAAQRYPDGRYDIVVEGRRRFEVVSLDRARPYLRADVRVLDETDGAEDPDLAAAVAKLFEGVLESIELSGQAVIDETWKDLDARSLSYKVAAALPVGEDAKQEILEIPDTASRLRRVAEALMALRRIGAAAGAG
jgi:Lon protease-like protein